MAGWMKGCMATACCSAWTRMTAGAKADKGDNNDVKSIDNHIHPLKIMYEMMAMMAMGPIKATTTM